MEKVVGSARNSITTRFIRAVRLCWHICTAMWLIFTRLPRSNDIEWAQIVHEWSIGLLKIFNLHTVVRGKEPERLQPENVLMVSNHVSWLDIFAIFTMQVPRFVAKQEISEWPIAGRITKSARTIFIDRKNRRDSNRINEIMADCLQQGACIAVFPESTTSDGSGLLPFKAALFESALISKCMVQPMAIRYLDRHGYFTTEPAYFDDISFLRSIWRILSMPTGIVELTYGVPIQIDDSMQGMTRYKLSDLVRKEIELCLTPVYGGETFMEINACVQHAHKVIEKAE